MTGILLIHGGWHGPWCWEGFADRLAGHGHDVRTVQLRGHDQRSGRIWFRLRHYLEDVERAARQFAEPPVLVGHSMGGLLAQLHLERHPTRGAVLLASLPRAGALGVAARLALRHPLAMLKVNLLLSLKPLVASPALVRALLFTRDTPQRLVDSCHARLQDESYPTFLDMVALGLRRPGRVHAPVLVLGAERDSIIPVHLVRRTARAYHTQPEIFPAMGHHMALEPGWEDVADRVDAWVRRMPNVEARR
jgi:pimeloyl-ACP methyl ester carboxylesterase